MMSYNLSVNPNFKKDDFLISFNSKEYDISVSKENFSFFKESIIPNLELILLKYNKLISKKMTSPKTLTNYLNLLYTYSPEFISKMTTEMKSLSTGQLELFFEYIKFNQNISEKFNPLFDLLRIKNGVLTKKVFFEEYSGVCDKTYSGFLRSIKDKTVKFIRLKIDGKDTVLLVKDYSGYLNNKKLGINILGMDSKTFNVYRLKSSIQNNRVVHNVTKASSNVPYHFIDLQLAKKYIKENRTSSLVNLKEVMDVINKIKLGLKDYTFKEINKRNEKFKVATKKMLSDPETRKVIKTRFRK